MQFSRFAVYFVPPDDAFAQSGAQWLGWDIIRGSAVAQPDIPNLARVSRKPRKYGFHATLKPPFVLKEGLDLDLLKSNVARLTKTLQPAKCDGLELVALGRMLALVPRGDPDALHALAATCVRELDALRAPLTEQELRRRSRAQLTQSQQDNLLRWGYPYVMDQFRFHMTLSGPLNPKDVPHWITTASSFMPALPQPFSLEQIALCGERMDGQFQLIERFPLGQTP